MSIRSTPCCSQCAEHGGSCSERQTGPPIGPAPVHTHGYLGSIRDSEVSPYGRIGDVSCDPDGNCYDSSTGIYTPAPVFSQYATPTANVNSALTWFSQNSAALAGLAAVVGMIALVSSGKGRR
jgi:hypothetical protein